MKKRLQELGILRDAAIKRMREIIESLGREQRTATDIEDVEYDRLEKGCEQCDKEIQRINNLLGIEARANTPVRNVPFGGTAVHTNNWDDTKDFRSVAEFLKCVRMNPHDDRLQESQARSQVMGDKTLGGFAVPEIFLDEVELVRTQASMFRGDCRVLPADPEHPDATLNIPALDQSESMFGGVEVKGSKEATKIDKTQFKLRQIKFTPFKIAALLVTSNELLENWKKCAQLITELFYGALISKEDALFLKGTGTDEPTGIITSPATIPVKRKAAQKIDVRDLIAMEAALYTMGFKPETIKWKISRTCLPELRTLKDDNGRFIWMDNNIAAGMPPQLLGMPVELTVRNPPLGTKGDVILGNFQHYLIDDGSGPIIQVSDQFMFDEDMTVFRIKERVDAKPLLVKPLPLEADPTYKLSPFVCLDDPAAAEK